jgi:hypothetical protein
MPSLALAGLTATAALVAANIGLGCEHGRAAAPDCERARIGKRIECLAVGEPCRPHYEKVYELYGLTCKRPSDGHYRLHERIYMGPPVP